MKLVESLPHDLLVHVGDITEHGFEHEYLRAKELFPRTGMHFVMGNHDARNVGYTLFEKYFGSPHGEVHHDGVACILLDSSVPDRNEGRVGKTDARRLKHFLNEYADETTVVALHHHVLPIPRSGRERGLLTDAGRVLKILLDYHADLVLSGHRHSYNTYKIGETTVVNSGTFSSYKTRAGDSHSCNLISLENGEITVTRYDFDSRLAHTERRTHRGPCLVPADERICRIVHTSDTHFGSSDFLPAVYDAAVKKIVQLSPDIVVHAGDVTHDGLQDSYMEAAAQLERLPYPKMVVPGVRDYQHLGEELFGEYFSSGNLAMGAVNLIWADSVKAEESEGYIGRRQLGRIVKAVRGDAMNIVVFHHHIVPVPHTRERDVIEDAGDVLKTLSGKVHLILNGSRHLSFSSQVDGTVVANSNTLSSRRVNGRYGNTFNVIDIMKNNSVVITEIGAVSGIRRVLGVYSPLCFPLFDSTTAAF
jgi:3',5'-cyclic AMP phosphodiesterase CpdA